MPIPVLIDTDPGADDCLALLLAGASPELDVVGVTTAAGNVRIEQTTENARRILPIAWPGGQPPLFRGNPSPAPTEKSVHGPDGLGGVSALRDGERDRFPPAAALSDEPAVSAISRVAREQAGRLVYVQLGPATNLAAALHADPELPDYLRELVVMGGAFREAGNITPFAEFNVWADPEAAQTVCNSGIPIRWVPMDATHRCLLTEQDLLALPDRPRVRLAKAALRTYLEYHRTVEGIASCYLHDPLAVGSLLWPELLEWTDLRVDVELKGEYTRGMTVADFRRGRRSPPPTPNARVALGISAEAAALFKERFLDRLCL